MLHGYTTSRDMLLKLFREASRTWYAETIEEKIG